MTVLTDVFSDSCRDPLVESSNVDLRFRTFVKNLDINDKAIQACFRSLIQVSWLVCFGVREII